MKAVKTIEELRKELAEAKSGCASDTVFIAKAMMFAIEQNEKLFKQINTRLDLLDTRVNMLLTKEIIKLKGEINAKRKHVEKGNEVQSGATSSSEGKENQSRRSNESDLEVHNQAQSKE